MNDSNKISEEREQALLLRVRPILAKELGIDEERVVLSAKLIEDLGVDSLDTVQLVMAFEEEFKINIVDEDVDKDKIKTVEDIVLYLAKRVGV